MREFKLDAMGQARLGRFFEGIGQVLGNQARRESFATYAYGLMSDAERKSVEPIAAHTNPEDAQCEHDRLLYFLRESKWDDEAVRQFAVGYALDAMQAREPIEVSVVDDTGFLKQGKKSPGVQRQYTGSAGKTANCQIAVSLSVCTPTEHLPLDMELYLPISWTEDAARCAAARIPKDVVFRAKWKIALDMITRASEQGIALGVVLADSWYGDVPAFRQGLDNLELQYSVGVHSDTMVSRAHRSGRRGRPQSVLALAQRLRTKAFKTVTWRDGTRRSLSSRFAAVRVFPTRAGKPCAPEQWLMIEWPKSEENPTDFTLSTMPVRTGLKKLVRTTKQRWRTERVYEDLKGELGLDHFEGRSFPGWKHHVTAVLSCFAFVQSERVRRFPPAAAWTCRVGADRLAA